MANSTPNIDPRSAKDVTRQVADLAKIYAAGWNEMDPISGSPTGFSGALINIFGRFAELIIQRLNQVPDKNYLAFLNLIGASLLPPQPARVPMTFALAAEDSPDAVVPPGTQVAAPPAEGETEPVIFETERELVVTAAQLNSIFVVDPWQDKYADLSGAAGAASGADHLLFQGDRRNVHTLYLGHDSLLGFPAIAALRLRFNLDRALGDDGRLEWDLWDGTAWKPREPVGSGQLDQIGENVVEFDAMIPTAESSVYSISNRWLRCRLTTPITPGVDALAQMVRQSRLPEVRRVLLEVDLQRAALPGLQPELAFYNSQPVDLGKDYFPFGEQPKPNGSFYLSSAEAFSKDRAGGLAAAGASIELAVQVANSHLIPASASSWPADDLQLAWECWNGQTWLRLGTSFAPDWLALLELDALPSVVSDAGLEVPQIVVQGTAQRAAGVTITSLATGFGQSVVIGSDRRFAATVPLADGLNMIVCSGQSRSRLTNAWVVVFMESSESRQTIQLAVQNLPGKPLPPGQKEIKLDVRAQGSGAGTVKIFRVTNGNAPLQSPTEWNVGQDPPPVPLVEGRNELLIEGLIDSQTTAAATTACVGREAAPPPPDAVTGFADGTYALCQHGTVFLQLPDTTRPTAVNGQQGYWLRVRLANGDYGCDAGYALKDPTDPSAGYVLTLASFRPPIVSDLKIGYQQTLTDLPEYCLRYNNLTFDDVSAVNQMDESAFNPFVPVPDQQPTVYLGFKLPPERAAFPNRTISLFARMAAFKYGEKVAPLFPLSRKAGGTGDSTVSHLFYISNHMPAAVKFDLSTYGTRWTTAVVPGAVQLEAGESVSVQVQVTIPTGTAVGNQDRGFLRLVSAQDPDHEYSAVFSTYVESETGEDRRLELNWEYGTDKDWSELRVGDDTENFIRSGMINFIAPTDFRRRWVFGFNEHWLRVRWDTGQFPYEPRLSRVLTNTTMAAQTITLRNENLGSSDGSENQRFRTTRLPVLVGQQLEVREPEQPSAEEQATIEKEEGPDAVTIRRDTAGRLQEIWVRWHEVPDFYGSGPRDRHYVLDHITGEIRFGDGLHGLVPAVGSGNIRMRRYQTGGGRGGNKAANTIIQLKTTVPYVGQATNPEPASGGADAEASGSLLERASRSLRHRERAVTRVDFEDLALLASPDVARALCVPLYNLVLDPDASQLKAGILSLIIVPRSDDIKPLPSRELIERVGNYLNDHQIPTLQLIIVGPEYIRVDVELEIALVALEGASEVRRNVAAALSDFLHPLSGGLEGKGWDFGRRPHKSDLYALIEPLAGVDHIRSLKVTETEERPGVQQTGRFLVYSGTHTIRLIFSET